MTEKQKTTLKFLLVFITVEFIFFWNKFLEVYRKLYIFKGYMLSSFEII
jgi:hypothetical protein